MVLWENAIASFHTEYNSICVQLDRQMVNGEISRPKSTMFLVVNNCLCDFIRFSVTSSQQTKMIRFYHDLDTNSISSSSVITLDPLIYSLKNEMNFFQSSSTKIHSGMFDLRNRAMFYKIKQIKLLLKCRCYSW